MDITAQEVDLDYEHYVAIVHCPGRPNDEAVEYSIGQIVQESRQHILENCMLLFFP